MQNKLSIKSAFAAVLCISLAVFLADKSLYSGTISGSFWSIPFGKPSSIWTAISYNYEMEPSSDSAQNSVTSEIHWFQKHQDYITELTHNAQPYIYYVYQQLKKRHMPAELALLPMVESSYQPFQSSNVGATGLWQMMPDTASGLGLKASGEDGRRNVIASTNAALNYLAYLHRVFGNWPLALAAYNAGEGTVQKAIQKNVKEHLPTNFWSLHLPKQTEEYVPKLLALAAIMQNPARYNVHLEPVDNKAYFGAVKVENKINLAAVAKLSGTDPQTIQKLNPGIKSPATPITPVKNTNKTTYLLVPVDKLPVLQAKLKDTQLTNKLVAQTVKPAAATHAKAAPAVKKAMASTSKKDHAVKKAAASTAKKDQAKSVAHKAAHKPAASKSSYTKAADKKPHHSAKTSAHTSSTHNTKSSAHRISKKTIEARITSRPAKHKSAAHHSN